MDRPDAEMTEELLAARAGLMDRIARNLVLRVFEKIQRGRLEVWEAGTRHVFGNAQEGAPEAVVEIRDPGVYRSLLTAGSIGAGETYMRADWTSPNLTNVFRVFSSNLGALDALETGLGRLGSPFLRLAHWLRRNTPGGSRENIAAHYDLGNQFFELFLDREMMYSSAFFPNDQASLEEASVHKMERICRKLQITERDHLLEIGTGWGGMAVYAAKSRGCRVTTTTISRQQHEYASERVGREGLAGRVEVLLEDYRDLRGKYSKLVSIEMIEAVGHAYLDTFFQKCSTLLKRDGLLLLQAIVTADQRYEQAKRTVDFIQRYIFPGGFVPSVGALLEAMKHTTDMRLVHLEDIASHYARTLRLWRERFLANLGKVRRLGYEEEFCRMWEFYLSYCEGGFLERFIGNVQMVMAKPLDRSAPVHGAI